MLSPLCAGSPSTGSSEMSTIGKSATSRSAGNGKVARVPCEVSSSPTDTSVVASGPSSQTS